MIKKNKENTPTIIILFIVVGFLIYAYSDIAIATYHAWNQKQFINGFPYLLFAIFWSIYEIQKSENDKKRSNHGYTFIFIAFLLFLTGKIIANYWFAQLSFSFVLLGLLYIFGGVHIGSKTERPLLLLCFAMPLPITFQINILKYLTAISNKIILILFKVLAVPVYFNELSFDLGNKMITHQNIISGLTYFNTYIILIYIILFFGENKLFTRITLFTFSLLILPIINSILIFIYILLGPTALDYNNTSPLLVLFLSLILLTGFCLWTKNICINSTSKVTKKNQREKDPYKISEKKINAVYPLILICSLFIITPQILEYRVAKNKKERPILKNYPNIIKEWKGKFIPLKNTELSVLNLTDYVQMEFIDTRQQYFPTTVYIAYYSNQTQGSSIHSPSTCLQGAGWIFISQTMKKISPINSNSFYVNECIMKTGETYALVYYWFRQGDKNIATRLEEKKVLLSNVLFEGRADGSLIRYITPLPNGLRDINKAKSSFDNFFSVSLPIINKYI